MYLSQGFSETVVDVHPRDDGAGAVTGAPESPEERLLHQGGQTPADDIEGEAEKIPQALSRRRQRRESSKL